METWKKFAWYETDIFIVEPRNQDSTATSIYVCSNNSIQARSNHHIINIINMTSENPIDVNVKGDSLRRTPSHAA